MSSFFNKLAEGADKLVSKAEEGVWHARNSAIGILNPNRRHDDPEEKRNDMIRAEINASHRFHSFADQRAHNSVKWHIDGHDYMYALSEMIESAREVIYILDWWLTPELYLRRPPAYNEKWRLDRVLKRKAEQGVKIYVVVYKEVTQTMSMSSSHTKHALEALHPNIACMRHPDHIGSKDDVEFWSHHEKVVVVDQHRACIGGLDLCFGRWDTHTHPLADVHPTHFAETLFPGQDYNNARVLDFKDVSQVANNGISVIDTPRMPWHDVHMTLCGPVVLDIVQHFVERWNEIKKRKYRHEEHYDWLALPHDVEVAPDEGVARHPLREQWHSMGRSFKQRWHRRFGDVYPEEDEDPTAYQRPPNGTCRVQAVRSVSDWSHGVLTEKSIQNAYCQLILEANHFIYIENQFFISSTTTDDPVKNQIANALVQRILQAARDGQKFKVVVVIPEVPGFAGNIKDASSVQTIMAAQYRTINRGGHSIYEEIRKAGFEPMDYIRFYHLRAYDRINAPYPSFIKAMEDTSGVKFQQAMVALAREWVGQSEDGTPQQQSVMIVLPDETLGSSSGVAGDKNALKTETYPLPQSVDEARAIIERFEHGADGLRSDEDVSDNVVQHMLSDRTSLLDEKWLGSEEEERNAYVSELLYIHSKVMIVDDRRVIMGSANINDRSQKGDGDSEIAMVVEDEDMFETYMDGQKYMASRFAATLRRKLYKEHLGLIPPQLCEGPNEEVTSFMRPSPVPNDDELGTPEDNAVADPLSPSTEALWNDTARKNREIFTEIFRPVPTNLIRSWDAYAGYVPKSKTNHVVPDVPLVRVKDRLSQVRGALVECPLDFLIDQKDFVEGPMWSGLDPTLPIYI
ncbi:phospholipase D [Phanerochaete sordida]|uniref:Phospholipase n=1 Tax=Phanerochaete sordida TaxID=48140 RepID=A0A9P3LCW9_9APHY|nr:phospholipase D [Phanerochaete sordida]